jgi:uncharacterized protein DUF1552
VTFISKMALPRRTFLRGMGATVALPFLDAMVPALTAMAKTAAKPVARLGCIYIPNGYIQGAWVPTTAGAGFELTPSLSPLAAVQDQLIVLSGLDHLEANSKGDGNGDHPRATAVWLTGVHAWATADGVSGQARLGTSVDQIAAQELGKGTPLPSIELGLESATQITCDAGDCFFSNSISWRTPTTPLGPEAHPRVVFERLFGDGGSAAQRLAQIRKTGSILDSVTREVTGLEKALGSSDRSKLTEYLGAVRDVEQRIQGAEQRGDQSDQALPDRPVDIPEAFEDHARLMYDLQVLAYQADITRVFTMMVGREASATAFPQIGLPEQHHSLSHHLNNPDLMAKKARIDKHLVSLFAYFLEKLRQTPDGDGSLLDHALILYGGGLGNSNLHMHNNLPCLLAGGAASQLKGGRHLNYTEGTPMANLLLSMLDKVGVPTPEKIGDSTSHLSDL